MTRCGALLVLVLFGLILLWQGTGTALAMPQGAGTSKETEIEFLKRKILELESQNEKLAQHLSQIEDRLAQLLPTDHEGTAPPRNGDGSSRPAVRASVLDATPAGQAAPAKPAADPKPADGAAAVQWSELAGSGNRVRVHTSLRLDLVYDTRSPNNSQIPFFIPSPGSSGGTDKNNFTMHPRLSRLGFDYTSAQIKTLRDARLAGKFEFDFLNGGSESRQIIRIRHAYFTLKWNRFSLLGGQTWDVFAPLTPTVCNDSVLWNAGNLGDRRPQLRFAFEPAYRSGQWSFVGGIGLTGAVDPQDLDADGFRDGEVSGRPNIQARIGYARNLWVKDQPASLGVSGSYGWLGTVRPVGQRTEFHSQVMNVDYTLPLYRWVSMRGEGWFGHNLSDLRGGIGQGIYCALGREIRSRGGWSELKLRLSSRLSLHPGFALDDPVDHDLPAGGRAHNQAIYIAGRMSPSDQFTIGLDYLRWKTRYLGLPSGLDHRFNLSFQYAF